MHLLKLRRAGAVLAGPLLALALTGPASAGQAQIDLLMSYIGDWRGSGVVVGGDDNEEFSCRVTISRGGESKIFYAGRCALVSLNLSVSGAIGYNDEGRRYEANMASNTAFSGIAIGRQSGSTITFNLREREVDEQGRDMSIGSTIVLRQEQITIEFEVTFADSGESFSTTVPFSRHGS